MTTRHSICIGLLSLLLTAGSALGLGLGDPAPALKIATWVKGKPVDLKAGKGKEVYILEFWATWCPPCRKAIPHLTELQKKYKDKGVVVLGISDEDESDVQPFVKQAGSQMEYTVAVDRDEATDKAYMEAFGIDGIPHAFIVDKQGRIAWHGHPEVGMDQALEEILAGKYDLEAAKQADRARHMANDYFDLMAKAQKAANDKEKKETLKKAAQIGADVVKFGAKKAELLNAFSWTILTSPRITNRDLDLAAKAAKAAYDATDGKDASIVDTYARALFDTGKKADAIQLQKKAVDLAKDDEMRAELKNTLRRYETEAAANK